MIGGSPLGVKRNEETRRKIGLASKGRITKEIHQKMINTRILNKSSCKEKNPMSKLKQLQVEEIRKLYKTGEYSQNEISKMFNISQANVGRIVNFVTWKEDDGVPIKIVRSTRGEKNPNSKLKFVESE